MEDHVYLFACSFSETVKRISVEFNIWSCTKSCWTNLCFVSPGQLGQYSVQVASWSSRNRGFIFSRNMWFLFSPENTDSLWGPPVLSSSISWGYFPVCEAATAWSSPHIHLVQRLVLSEPTLLHLSRHMVSWLAHGIFLPPSPFSYRSNIIRILLTVALILRRTRDVVSPCESRLEVKAEKIKSGFKSCPERFPNA